MAGETIAVNAFEKVLAHAQHFVKHYHADNGMFAHKASLTRSIARIKK